MLLNDRTGESGSLANRLYFVDPDAADGANRSASEMEAPLIAFEPKLMLPDALIADGGSIAIET